MSRHSSNIQELLDEIKKLKEYKERLRLFEETSFEAITVYDENILCIDTNSMTTNLFQYGKSEIIGMSGLDFFDPGSRQTALDSVKKKNRMPYEALMRRKDGSTFPALIQGTTININERNLRVSTCRDISELINIRERAKQKDEEFQTIFETSSIGILFVKEDRIIERANQSAAGIFGYDSPDELIGQSIEIIHLSRESYKNFGTYYLSHFKKREPLKFDYQLKMKNGDPVWVNVSGSPVDHSTPPDLNKGVVWSIDDISQRKQAENELIRLTRTDPLTGIYNRAYFLELGNREVNIHNRYHSPLSVMMLDIDRFKQINDTFGHSTGDKAICFLVDLCREIIRDTDVFRRLGGEEFSILLLNTEKDMAYGIAERIRTELKNRTGNTEMIPSMTVSIGLTDVGGGTLEEALDRADKLLYKAKEGGRDRTCL